MKTKKLMFIPLLCILATACKKEVKSNEPAAKTTVSKMSLLNHEWILDATYVDDVQKTSKGLGKYKFEKNGAFSFLENGVWSTLANYRFTNKDSNVLAMEFNYAGTIVNYLWDIKKMDEKTYNVEFRAGIQKLNYNYIR